MWSERIGKGRPNWPHSLLLHLPLLLQDLVGLHRQPLLHEKLLPLQLALPHLFQPLPIRHEQLPALVGRKEAPGSVPGETWAPTATALGAQMKALLITVTPVSGTVVSAVSDPHVLWLGRDPLPLLCQSFRDGDTLGLSRERVADLRALSG